MGVIWGLPNWVWFVVAGVAFAASALIVRALAKVFAGVRDLTESLDLSRRMLDATLESTRDELARAQEGLARLSRRGDTGDRAPEGGDAWRDW